MSAASLLRGTESPSHYFVATGLVISEVAVALLLLWSTTYCAWHFRGTQWMQACAGGFVLGQGVSFAIWLTYSRCSWLFRLALVALLAPILATGYYVGECLARWPSTHWHLILSLPEERERIQYGTVGMWIFMWVVFVALIPMRYAHGVALTREGTMGASNARPFQFRIWQVMLWTCIIVTPLAVFRNFINADYLASSCLVALFFSGLSLIVCFPAFRAAFARRHLVWYFVALCGYLCLVCLCVTEVQFIWDLLHSRARPLDFSGAFAALGSACIATYLNCWLLRLLGIRLVENAERSTIASSDATSVSPNGPRHA
jgi:hypothetical protein